MTHTGEQGYVLYIPNEFAVEIYDSIMEAGRLIMILNKLPIRTHDCEYCTKKAKLFMKSFFSVFIIVWSDDFLKIKRITSSIYFIFDIICH